MNNFWVIGGGGTGAPSRWVAVIVTVPTVLPLMMKQQSSRNDMDRSNEFCVRDWRMQNQGLHPRRSIVEDLPAAWFLEEGAMVAFCSRNTPKIWLSSTDTFLSTFAPPPKPYHNRLTDSRIFVRKLHSRTNLGNPYIGSGCNVPYTISIDEDYALVRQTEQVFWPDHRSGVALHVSLPARPPSCLPSWTSSFCATVVALYRGSAARRVSLSACLPLLSVIWLNLVSCFAIMVQYWIWLCRHGSEGCGGLRLSIMWSLLYPASPHIPVSENVAVNARGRSPRGTHTA